MDELKRKLIELKALLESQNNGIAHFIAKIIVKIDEKDNSFIDDILGSYRITDFMHYKAAFLFDKIWSIANNWKMNSEY